MKALIADNNQEHRRILVEYIEKLGCTVVEAISSGDVIEVCKKKCPELLLIDKNLSGVSGFELVQKIRQLGSEAAWVSIVLMGESPDINDFEKAISSGADDFFNKPVDLIRLSFKLHSASRQEEMRDQVFTVAHELVMANRALESCATQDTMTGISDVNTFHQALEHEWLDSKNNQLTLSMILINIDYFRDYNATYGSDQGDLTIKRIAVVLKTRLPQAYKLLARTTGDTFAILLPKTSANEAIKLAETLRQAVEDLKISNTASHCSEHLTVSCGVASTEDAELKNPLDLLETSDYALYEAKHKGRNRVYFAPIEIT